MKMNQKKESNNTLPIYCHDSVYDALFLALTPTQAIAGLRLTFTPHNSQPLVTHHLTYAYRLTHPYLPSHMTPS